MKVIVYFPPFDLDPAIIPLLIHYTHCHIVPSSYLFFGANLVSEMHFWSLSVSNSNSSINKSLRSMAKHSSFNFLKRTKLCLLFLYHCYCIKVKVSIVKAKMFRRNAVKILLFLPILRSFQRQKPLTEEGFCKHWHFFILNFTVIIFSILPFNSLVPASVSAHHVPTVCNGREIVDSTTSSL